MKEEELRKLQGARLREARERRFKSKSAAARALRVPLSTYSAHERGSRTMGQDDASKYGRKFGVDPKYLLFPAHTSPVESPDRKPIKLDDVSPVDFGGTVTIRELDFRPGIGGGAMVEEYTNSQGEIMLSDEVVRDNWVIPPSFMRGVLRVDPRGAWICEVQGDSGYDPANPGAPGSLFPGDRVLVDTNDRRPSPPGPFMVHDGVGLVVKLVSVVPNTEPVRVRLSSRNPAYEPYERTDEEARIIGRVRARISAL